jgi:2-dehydropantoate 2-reductase
MNTLLIGPGRIGSTFAFHLALAGHTVNVLARGHRLEALRRDPAIVSVDGRRAPVTVVDALDETVPYDLIVVTILSHHVDALVPMLAASRAAAILFMFNTFDKTAKWRAALGAERLVHGFPNMQASLESGRLRSVINGPGMVTTLSSARWAELLEQAGMPTEFEPDMDSFLRTHVAFVVPLMIAGLWTWQRSTGLTWAEARRLTAALTEALALVRSLGHTAKPAFVSVLAALPGPLLTGVVWLFSRSASVKALGEFGPEEVRALIDAMVVAGPERTAKVRAIRP